MNLRYNEINARLIKQDCSLNITIIESPLLFRNLMDALHSQLKGEDDRLILSSHSELLPLERYLDYVGDPFALQYNTRKEITQLHKYLCQILFQNGRDLEIMERVMDLQKALEQALIVDDIEVGLDQITLQDVVNFFDVQYIVEREDFVAMIEQYMRIKRRYSPVRIFVFHHLLAYITDKELERLFNFVTQEEIVVWLIESSLSESQIIKGANCLIIDKDLCEIELHLDN